MPITIINQFALLRMKCLFCGHIHIIIKWLIIVKFKILNTIQNIILIVIWQKLPVIREFLKNNDNDNENQLGFCVTYSRASLFLFVLDYRDGFVFKIVSLAKTKIHC